MAKRRSAPSGPTTSIIGQAAIDHGSVGAAGTLEASVVMTGDLANAAVGDQVSVSVASGSTLDAGLVVGGAAITAAATLTVRLGNVTAGAIDPAAITYDVAVIVG